MLALITVAVVLLLPKLFRWRYLSLVLLLPIFLKNPNQLIGGSFQVNVLDVGQGSSAVIQTKNHVLVFDAGAKFSDRMDVGKSVVIPYLRSQGIRSLDVLLISHGDADHIGGAPAIIDEYPEVEVIGQDIETLKSDNKRQCVLGQSWHWDGVDFEILSPLSAGFQQNMGKRNDHSCVLRVMSDTGSLLLTGDIEKNA
ncbi:MAG: MBL fold metallo-hydrolase, partial [Proteobacteria bacterium]|nr:MBL fold metallo-hydrolase [Pseudomonadota bacterium]